MVTGMDVPAPFIACPKHRLLVNCVVPGVIKNPLWDSMPESDREGLYQYVSNSVLAKRVGKPEDIAEGFRYLMKQKHGTGQSLLIDGGTLLV